MYNEGKDNYQKALNIAPHRPGNLKLHYALVLTYLKEYGKAYELAFDLSENEQYFGGSQLGALGTRAF